MFYRGYKEAVLNVFFYVLFVYRSPMGCLDCDGVSEHFFTVCPHVLLGNVTI